MKILIIGGTGFISGNLVQKLLDAGHWVTVLTRGKSTYSFAGKDKLTIMRGDRRDADFLCNAVRNQTFDVVFDMIAYAPEESQLAVKVFRGKAGRFIHCSTISVYMVSWEVQCPITEDQDKTPLMEFWDRNPFGMDYGIKKRQCEDVLWEAHDEKRFPVSVLRPTFVCGPRDPTMRDWFWIERLLDGKPLLVPGSGDFAFQQVYVGDIAKMFVTLLDYPDSIGKAYNIAGEEIFSLNEYLQRLGTLLGREPEIVHVDQNVFNNLTFSTHPHADVFPFNVQRTSVFSLDRIKHDLHYVSTPFRQWMLETIEWYVQNCDRHSYGYDRREEELEFMEMWKRVQQQLQKEALS